MLAVVFLFIVFGPLWAQQKNEPRPLITVMGTSEVQAVPDLVDLQVGLETRSKDLKAAVSEQEARLKQILDLVRRSGIESRDVQTSHVEIQPVYMQRAYQEGSGMNLSHYEVRNSIGLTLREPAKYDELLSTLLQSGANRVFGVTFRNSRQRQYRDQAREMAVIAAREKAAFMAEKLGQHIGKVFTIEEEEQRFVYANPSNSMAEAAMSQTEATESSLALGQITFRARVKVSFELK
jgi:hypothetical protein